MTGEVRRILGRFLLFYAAILLVPLGVSFYYEHLLPAAAHPQPHATTAFLWTALIALSIGLVLRLGTRQARGHLHIRAAVLCVGLLWLLASMIGALPFLLNGTLHHFVDGWFESVSGLTTTGASILQAKAFGPTGAEVPIQISIPGQPPAHYTFDGTVTPVFNEATGQLLTGVEALAKGLLFWRALLNWLGGVGIIVLFLAILPTLQLGGRALFESEATGPVKEALTPRLRKTALSLWRIYLVLTLVEILLLVTTNARMGLFDAITVSFATLATGGFTATNDSIGTYASAVTDWIVIIFMILGSISFGLYYAIRRGHLFRLRDAELGTFLSLTAVTALLVSLALYSDGLFDWWTSLRHGTFQMVSAITTTGFYTVDFNTWPAIPQSTMLVGMLVGGMAGSTAGGLKTIRLILLCRIAVREIEASFRPQLVGTLQLQGRSLEPPMMRRVLTFFFILAATGLIGALLLIADGVDMRTAFSSSVACINNVGFSFGATGPANSFAMMSGASKVVCTALMLLGRLEFFVLLTLLLPAFWRQR